MKSIKVNNFEISNDKQFTLIAGPCVIESRDHAMKMAELIKNSAIYYYNEQKILHLTYHYLAR